MNTGWTDAAHNQTGSAQGPDLIITTPKIFNIYQDIATVGNLRITNQVANLGFYAVEFGPGVAMVFDKYLTANYIYMLTLEDWRLHVFAGANFSFDGWRRGEDQDASKAHILWHGQLRLDSPWQQTVFSSVGAT
ncbi:hypothetical protein HY405_00895 [Candidatus Microgenomates bacterium]|nr:hypothetical protein [Candidatus Microgenomates bacterium]